MESKQWRVVLAGLAFAIAGVFLLAAIAKQQGASPDTTPPLKTQPKSVGLTDGRYRVTGKSTAASATRREASCEDMVEEELGGIEVLGGRAKDWRAPDWPKGAWEYVGPSTVLRWPGFGYFDTWRQYGGQHITRDFTAPTGDAEHVSASFHCFPE